MSPIAARDVCQVEHHDLHLSGEEEGYTLTQLAASFMVGMVIGAMLLL